MLLWMQSFAIATKCEGQCYLPLSVETINNNNHNNNYTKANNFNWWYLSSKIGYAFRSINFIIFLTLLNKSKDKVKKKKWFLYFDLISRKIKQTLQYATMSAMACHCHQEWKEILHAAAPRNYCHKNKKNNNNNHIRTVNFNSWYRS